MAVDEAEPAVTPLEQLRRERAGIRRRLGDGPADPSWDYRHLSEALAREKNGRQGARWRLDTARKSLQDLGPIGRRTRRAERRELECRVAGFEADIDRHYVNLVDLEARLAELTPEVLARSRWEREHITQLHRLDALDRQITWNEGVERVVTRELERGLELGLERGHGIEL